jgi:hypothetical protein
MMGAMKELAYLNRVCVKHGPFYQHREWFASELFDECPVCEQEAVDRENFEAGTVRLNWAADELQDFAKRDATTEEIAWVQQAISLVQLCLASAFNSKR